MAYYTGTGASVQIGREEEWGTAVTPDALVDLTSESVEVTAEKGDEGSLLASKTAMSRDLLSVTVSGSVDFILRPEGAGQVLRLALGGEDDVAEVTEYNGVTLADTMYLHTFTLCGVNEELPGLTMVIDRRAAVRQYAGCTVSSLSLECAAGDYVKASLEVSGVKEEAGELSAGLTGFTVPAYRCTAAEMTLGGTVYDISTATVTFDNALEEAPRVYSSGLYAGRPLHGRRSVTISFELPYSEEVDSLRDGLLLSEETTAVTLLFTSSKTDYMVGISMPHVAVTAVSANVDGTGVLTASCEGEALSEGGDEPVVVTMTDMNGSAY